MTSISAAMKAHFFTIAFLLDRSPCRRTRDGSVPFGDAASKMPVAVIRAERNACSD
jgi:hypothetical protein